MKEAWSLLWPKWPKQIFMFSTFRTFCRLNHGCQILISLHVSVDGFLVDVISNSQNPNNCQSFRCNSKPKFRSPVVCVAHSTHEMQHTMQYVQLKTVPDNLDANTIQTKS